MRPKHFTFILTMTLLVTSLSLPLHSQVLISLIFGDELNSDSLQMIVNHDDSLREYDYEADKMRKLCQDNGWQVISMKDDFKVVFEN